MTVYLLGVLYLGTSLLSAFGLGRGIRIADTAGEYLAPVIPINSRAAWAGEESRRPGPPPRPLPAHLSPRAGSATRRTLRRLARSQAATDLKNHGGVLGLLLAGVGCALWSGGAA